MLSTAVLCLAMNVYHEARNDGMTGQYAVAHVVMNRVAHNKYPDDVCSVVKQTNSKGRCQFSWYCDGKSDKPHDEYAWAYAQMVAQDVLSGEAIDQTDAATHYHADYVMPYWAKHFQYTVTYGTHLFYKQ